MEEIMKKKKAHVVCIPAPAQGHITPMMQVAKLLHSRGFFITFVNTDYSQRRMLRSMGKESMESNLDGFRFETIADGLPPGSETTKGMEAFCKSIHDECLPPFRELLRKLQGSSISDHGYNDGVITCIISDAFMSFTLKAAEELGIPEVMFCPTSSCGFMAYAHYHELMRRGLAPLKDKSDINNGYLDTIIDWIPGMKEMRLRDLGSFLLTTPPNDFMLKYTADEAQNALKAPTIIFNTFDDLENEVLNAFRSMFSPHIYSIGPLSLQSHLLPNNTILKSSLLEEDADCMKWLDSHIEAANSVIYVNFGSTTIITPQQLIEFAWGIANSNHPFLWVIRPGLVMGGQYSSILPQEFMNEIEGRGMLVNWCPQEEVLAHPSIAIFLTHAGWNSILESLSFGVPMMCWPFFGDHQTNCRYACKEWGVGMEIDGNADREEIGVLVKEAMEGDRGKEMKKAALKWKESAEIAVKEGGSSHTQFELLIKEILLQKDNKLDL